MKDFQDYYGGDAVKRISIILILAISLLLSSCSNTASDANKSESANKSQNQTETVVQDQTQSQNETQDSQELNFERPAKDFTLKNLNGDTVSLSKQKDKVVVINFFTTWCKYCDVELPGFIKVMDEYRNNNKVVFLYIDVQEDKDTIETYLKDKGFKGMNVLLDEDGSVFESYNGQGFPTTYIIGRKGDIVVPHVGYMDEDTLKKGIEEALAK